MVTRGFSLLELILVISLIGLLAGIVTVSHKNAAIKARENVLRHNLSELRLTLDQYNNDKGHYPETLEALVDEGYLRTLPLDPILQSTESWEVVYDTERFDDLDSDHIPGIFDIRSGSDAVALDGTYYNEW